MYHLFLFFYLRNYFIQFWWKTQNRGFGTGVETKYSKHKTFLIFWEAILKMQRLKEAMENENMENVKA